MYANDIVMQLLCVYYNLFKSTDLTASVFILQIKLSQQAQAFANPLTSQVVLTPCIPSQEVSQLTELAGAAPCHGRQAHLRDGAGERPWHHCHQRVSDRRCGKG